MFNLILVVLFLSSCRSDSWMNDSAQDEFSSFLNEFDIDRNLFAGPSVSTNSVNDSYRIYT
ncbi:hypothetical protein GCM10027291_46670 [Telluribacter humicola]